MRKLYFILSAVLVAVVSCSKENPAPSSTSPEMIDLGLSVKWASFNVGATKPEEYGTYFAWGDVTGQTWDGSKWSGNGFSTEPKYELDANGNLKPEYDAAHVNLGGEWRMPTKSEQQELIDNCTCTWTDNYNGTGVAGRRFTSKINGNSIFLPAAGYGYDSNLGNTGTSGCDWSSTFGSDNYAWYLRFYTDSVYTNNYYRRSGRSVRAVCGPAIEPVADICGNTYPVVKIGNQIWMAENLRCDKYDTESEAYKTGMRTISSSPASDRFLPYYIITTDKTKWDTQEYAGKLSSEQIAKLGYLYNWAAAVGVADGKQQTTAFTGNRQGICPNGWHVPTNAEWQTLYDYIYGNQKLSENKVGKYLKTASGWPDNNGLNTYGFNALPAAGTAEGTVHKVGYYADFFSATPASDNADQAVGRFMLYNDDMMRDRLNDPKDYGRSIRCVKN